MGRMAGFSFRKVTNASKLSASRSTARPPEATRSDTTRRRIRTRPLRTISAIGPEALSVQPCGKRGTHRKSFFRGSSLWCAACHRGSGTLGPPAVSERSVAVACVGPPLGAPAVAAELTPKDLAAPDMVLRLGGGTLPDRPRGSITGTSFKEA